MRFKLLEVVPRIPSDVLSSWNSFPRDRKLEIIDDIITAYNNPSLMNIKDVIQKDFMYNGIDPSKNQFMHLIDELEFRPTKNQSDNFDKLVDMIESNSVDLSHDYLREKSLYDRSPQEFTYTVNAFETVMNPRELSKYFKDTTYISADQFRNEDGTIKSAGNKNTADDIDTIYGTIEQWTKTESGNDNTTGEKGTGLYTLNDALKHFNVSNYQVNDVVKEWIRRYFTASRQYYVPLSNDIDYYTETFDYLVKNTNAKPLTDRQKQNIKKQYQFGELKDIPRNLWKQGQMVWLRETEHQSSGPSDDSIVNDVVVFDNGQWIRYDDYINSSLSDSSNIDYVKRQLFNTHVIKDISNKKSITAGVLELLDKVDLDKVDGEIPLEYADIL